MIDEGWNSHGIECMSASFQVLLYKAKLPRTFTGGFK